MEKEKQSNMTQEDKELLLKDLCARLPYGVMVRVEVNDVFIKSTDEVASVNTINMFDCPQKFRITPYLRPMSSITKEEEEEFEELFIGYSISRDRNCVYHSNRGDLNLGIINWLNANHFDYRGLIPMGLALEAKEGMYNIKEK